jgi:hypothetical protein
MMKPWRLATTLVAVTVIAWITIIYVTEVKSPSSVVLWRDRQALDDFATTHRVLSGFVIDEVTWRDEPFEDALTQLESWIHQSSPDANVIHFDVSEGVSRQTPITLKFRAVPANEVLRYLTALNQARFDFRSDGLIEISPFDAVPRELPDGWFSIDSAFFQGVDLTQPDAIREHFRSAGIALSPSNKIEFFPDRDLLKISSNSSNLDLIDAYLWSGCGPREPAWQYYVSKWWYQAKTKLRLASPPVPATPSAVPLSPDHFGAPSQREIGAPPNPFGN